MSTQALLEQFISESRELLEAAGSRFLELESRPDDPELVNDLFRAMHTIKGNSGLFEIPALTRTVHAAEDVLVAVREGRLRLGPDEVDLLLDAMDQVGVWLDELERDGRLGEGADEAGDALAARLRALLGGPAPAADGEAGGGGGRGEAAPAAPAPPPEWVAALPGRARAAAWEAAAAAGTPCVAVGYEPDENCFFAGDDPLQTVRSAPGLAWLEVAPREPWPDDPGALDPFRCVLRFRLLCAAEPEAVAGHFQYAGDEARIAAFDPLWLAVPEGEPQGDALWGEVADDLQAALDAGDAAALRARAGVALEAQGGEGWEPDCLRWIARLAARGDGAALARVALLVEALRSGRLPEDGSEADTGPGGREPAQAPDGAAPAGAGPDPTARELLAAQAEMLRTPCAAEVWDGRLAAARAVCGRLGLAARLEPAFAEARARRDARPVIEAIEGLLEGGEAAGEAHAEARAPAAAEAALADAGPQAAPAAPPRSAAGGTAPGAGHAGPDGAGRGAAPPPPAPDRAPGGEGGGRPRIRTLKVDLGRIDALMELVGELVVAKNALPYLARRAEEVHGARELAREIKAQHAVLHRVTESLQAAVMQVRMIPLSHVFQRFPRLVRDLSRRLGRPIRLVIEGEEAEADKNVVEDLAEPLVHLIRNACDHGIEPPEEREAAGKPREGTVRLRAEAHDDHVTIEVSDDGRGMDPAVLRRKAYEKGIISEAELEALDDQAALQLVFAPGFSTAERVSDVSGRGVGMDAVRAMVRRVGGEVRVRSTPGAGTTVRLVLPLSVAVSQVMIVEAGGQHFGVPVELIRETVRVPAGEIHRVKDREAVVLRDRLVPVHRLHRLLGLEEGERPEEEALLVVRVDGETAALVVDRFHEGVDVIQKPLEGVMARFTIYSGTALLGDGRVLLILNLRELLRCP